MQPRVTVALATVWLTVAGLVGGAVTLRLSHDQYSPATPRYHTGVQRDQTGDWRDHEPAEDQPLDLWIGSRRSISAEDLATRDAKFVERDFPFAMPLKDVVSSKRAYPLSGWQKWLPNIADVEFAVDKVDYGYEMPETLSREAMVPPSDLLDDPFVADDTFQDQGPGSVEIYKLDLSKEKALLTATTPSSTNSADSRNKSKAPKKTDHLSTKAKTTEIKSTTMSPKIHHRQSNFFEEQRTETPTVNRDSFGVGGVPELQVGCEGLEALSSHKVERSIDTPGNESGQVASFALLDATPVSLDLDFVSYEDSYEEMDELFKLKKLETTTKGNKPNRGDMDASYLNSYHLEEHKQPDKLPVRGDLGESTPKKFSELKIGQNKPTDSEIKKHEEIKAKRGSVSSEDDDGTSRNRGRRLLWLAEANTEGFADGESERKRTRRSIDWGYGENEGVVSSDELQTLSQRRRQHDMRYHQDASRRRDQHQNGVNPEIDNIRREHEQLLEQKRREDEERRWRVQQGGRSNWEEERRRDEMRRRQHENYNRRTNHVSTSRADDEDTQQRQVEERQTQEPEWSRTLKTAGRNEEEQKRRREEEERRRRYNRWQESARRTPESVTPVSDEERRRLYDEQRRREEEEERQRRLQEAEARRQEQYRAQQEAQRRKDEEERRRQEDSLSNLSENDRRRFEEHRRELERRRQKEEEEEEDERRRQQAPSSMIRPGSQIGNPNDVRQRDRDDEERRAQEQEERRREQKLREYIARNRPINVSRVAGRSEDEEGHNRPEESRDPRVSANRNDEEYRRRAEEQRGRQDEERKLQDYIRRNQPVNVPSRSNQSTATDRNLFEERRLIEEARRRDRYPDPGARRQHGPSASTYIDPRGSPEEVRRRQQETARRLEEERRQRYEAEERRKELARRQREEEEEERRLREERMRKEAARREEEVRREQSRRYEEDRKRQEEARLHTSQRWQDRHRGEARVFGPERSEVTRPIVYKNPHLLAEHRRRQDSRPIPNNLVRNQEEHGRIAAERERQEAEKRRQEERLREDRQKETDQSARRRQEVARLNSLPVSARIIVRPGDTSRPVSPAVIARAGFDNEIDFTGINPHREGVKVPQFPVPPTRRPPVQSPGPCVWAVVQCCSNKDRLVKCFESMGCPGINWDPNPCRSAVVNAARIKIMKFYENQ